MPAVNVLAIDDDPGLLRLMERRLKRDGYAVTTATDAVQGLERLADGGFDVVTVDQNMPGPCGLDLARRIVGGDRAPPVVMITGQGSESIAAEALRLGVDDYLIKDGGAQFIELLPPVIARTLAKHRILAEKHAAERALAQRAQEMEAFAFIAAHDLKAPVGRMAGLARMLRARLDGAEPMAQQMLTMIDEQGDAMLRLIDDMLALARAGRVPPDDASCDLAVVLARVRDNLADPIAAADARIEAPDLPAVACDETSMVQLFQNLVGNALKYQPPGNRPLVRVGAEPAGPWWTLRVSDNGLGIPEDYRDKVFAPLTRVPGTGNVAGTGLGLATCARVVAAYGGGIVVEPAPDGAGACFRFTLPALPER